MSDKERLYAHIDADGDSLELWEAPDDGGVCPCLMLTVSAANDYGDSTVEVTPHVLYNLAQSAAPPLPTLTIIGEDEAREAVEEAAKAPPCDVSGPAYLHPGGRLAVTNAEGGVDVYEVKVIGPWKGAR